VAEFIASGTPCRELSEVQRQNLLNKWAHKYANMNAPAVCRDFRGKSSSKHSAFLFAGCKRLVGSIAQAKEELWNMLFRH